MNKKTLTTALALGALAIAGTTYIGVAKADYISKNDKQNQMVQDLSQKLGVDQSKVQSAFDEIRQERQAERKGQMEANLDKAVSDGVITAEQKQLLLNKQSEMQQNQGKKRGEMREWAEDNGIDFTKLKDYMGGFGFKHGGPLGD